MSYLKKIRPARNIPVPEGTPALEFRLWSYGNMKPINAIPFSVTVNNVAGTVMDIFIPKNTWAYYKRLIVWADFGLDINPPNAPGGDTYQEAYNLHGFGVVNRGNPGIIANLPLHTRYVMERQFVFEPGGGVYEENWNTVGVTTLFQAQGIDHRIDLTGGAGAFDNTIDNVISFLISNNNAAGASLAFVHSATAYIQSPVNLKRLV